MIEASLRFEGRVTPEEAKGQQAAGVGGRIDLSYLQAGLGAEGDERRVVRSIRRLDSTLVGGEESLSTGQLLVADDRALGARVAPVGGSLTRTQLDTVQLAADPLDIDTILPAMPVRDSATWKVRQEAIERVFRIEADTVCDVVAIVSDVTAGHVRLRFAGPVHGTADGAEVEIELRGVALFDRSLNRLTRFNLAWKEKRTVGPATPALEATAKLNLAVRLAGEDERITEAERKLALTTPVDDRLLVTPRGGWQMLAERDWFVVADSPSATTLRRIKGAEVAAVTTLTTRTKAAMAVPQLEREVRDSLGDQLGRVVSTSVGETRGGDAWLSIVSVGQAEERPVHWRHDYVSDGKAAVAVTTTRADTEDALAEAAVRRLIGSLEPAERSETASAEQTIRRR